MKSLHSMRLLVALLALLGHGSSLSAATWHHRLGRELGIGWSDGYHSREGCPGEPVGRRKYPGYPGGDPYSDHASPQRSWRGPVPADAPHPDSPRGRAVREELHYAPEIGAPEIGGPATGGPKVGEPTPVGPRRPVPPVDPSLPGKSSSHESRRPSQMFPLAPIR